MMAVLRCSRWKYALGNELVLMWHGFDVSQGYLFVTYRVDKNGPWEFVRSHGTYRYNGHLWCAQSWFHRTGNRKHPGYNTRRTPQPRTGSLGRNHTIMWYTKWNSAAYVTNAKKLLAKLLAESLAVVGWCFSISQSQPSFLLKAFS